MTTSERLTEVLKSSNKISFRDDQKFIIFSDCHRGDNGWSDDFADNQNLFFYALSYYLEKGFTYIELGDGDELWENKKFEDIRQAHSNIFWLIKEFFKKKRYYRVLGNHDMEFKDKTITERKLFRYYDERKKREEPLFEDITIPEGLILQHSETGKNVLLVHGHQGDFLSDDLWKTSRFLVRYIWKPLQTFGVHDPTSTAKNYKKRDLVDTHIIAWAKENNQTVIAGHTHRPVFPSPNDPVYFNSGSCVHPRCITGLEIENRHIRLIKWHVNTKPDTGELYVATEVLEGPVKIF
jgi:UDP-2,3-diacylglucosamine pyrophosphatase LpxH